MQFWEEALLYFWFGDKIGKYSQALLIEPKPERTPRITVPITVRRETMADTPDVSDMEEGNGT